MYMYVCVEWGVLCYWVRFHSLFGKKRLGEEGVNNDMVHVHVIAQRKGMLHVQYQDTNDRWCTMLAFFHSLKSGLNSLMIGETVFCYCTHLCACMHSYTHEWYMYICSLSSQAFPLAPRSAFLGLG